MQKKGAQVSGKARVETHDDEECGTEQESAKEKASAELKTAYDEAYFGGLPVEVATLTYAPEVQTRRNARSRSISWWTLSCPRCSRM